MNCKFCNNEYNTKQGLTYHENRCYNNPNRKKYQQEGKPHSEEAKRIRGKTNRMGLKNPNSILDMSKRTVSKIIARSGQGCMLCGWNEASCDIHHIIEKSNNGSNLNSNLIVVCPNCHRKIHNKIIFLDGSINIESVMKENWKKYYYALKC